MGEWSDKEKQEVRRITDAHQRAHSYSAGFRDASEERYRAAYERLSRMTAGDIARVRVGQTDYLMAAFPADWPERCLVLFVK
jgi:hypothetical protein